MIYNIFQFQPYKSNDRLSQGYEIGICALEHLF